MLIESSYLAPTWVYWLGRGGLNKGAIAPASASVPGESCPDPCSSALTLKQVNSVLSHLSMALVKLMPLHWSPVWVILWDSESMFRPLNRNTFSSRSRGFWQPSFSPRCNPHWFSQPDVMGTPLPSIGVLGWGFRGGAGSLTPHRKPPKLKYPFWFLIISLWVWDLPVSHIHPLLSVSF